MKISKRFLDRAKGSLRKYQKLLESARARDVNESDTTVIVGDFLAEVLGWDKYSEVTTEFCIRSTFCDLALKVDGRPAFLIEVKPIGTDLKDNHLRQAVDYSANSGIEWVLLTNGIEWQAHRLRFEKPIVADEVFVLDLLDPEAKPAQILEKLYLLSREAVNASAITKYWQQKEATSRYVIAQMLIGDLVLGSVRRQLRRQFAGLKVTEADLRARVLEEVFKRDVIEGERATAAERLVKRSARRRARERAAEAEVPPAPPPVS
ncbi:MAG TPA: type I restriction enzyme HsdR N-terminal domain-containing protein [Gemmatimonadaceae bacterium]